MDSFITINKSNEIKYSETICRQIMIYINSTAVSYDRMKYHNSLKHDMSYFTIH